MSSQADADADSAAAGRADADATRRDYAAEADAALESLTGGLAAEQAALALAVLANRTVARLHALSRGEATARKEQPDWPLWAQLQNASRTLVLQASTCRDLAAKLTGRRQ